MLCNRDHIVIDILVGNEHQNWHYSSITVLEKSLIDDVHFDILRASEPVIKVVVDHLGKRNQSVPFFELKLSLMDILYKELQGSVFYFVVK